MVARRQPRERKVESPERVMSREHPFQNEFREEERGAERPGLEPERLHPSLANTPLEHRWIAGCSQSSLVGSKRVSAARRLRENRLQPKMAAPTSTGTKRTSSQISPSVNPIWS